ncbi:MAG: biotin-dependent carboxyltransferase family protein [Acidobacteriota bacterium]
MPVPVLKVLRAGLMTTLQDLGRGGYQRFGVSPCGAMDPFALRSGNRLVGNPDSSPCLELTLVGPDFLVLADGLFAVTGGKVRVSLAGEPVPLWQAFSARRGDLLHLGVIRPGARCYLSTAGGFESERVFGSAATDSKAGWGGVEGRALVKGDVVWRAVENPPTPGPIRTVRPQLLEAYHNPGLLRVVWGPQSEHFNQKNRKTFLASQFQVTPASNRMAYRLSGPPLKAEPPEILSDPIPPGSLQVLPNGQMALLMADRQTIGGFPKIAVVISADLPKAAQLNLGESVRFLPVTLDLAHQLLLRQEEDLSTSIVEATD